MTQEISLKEADRKVFRTVYNDGLSDIFLGFVFLMFAIAPFLSPTLGDFWSSAVFLPLWGLAFLAIWLIRKYVVNPRLGVVKFGRARKTRLMKFTFVMVAINVIAFILGLVAAMSFGKVTGQIYTLTLGLILLIGFSVAANFLEFSRLCVYGVLVGLSFLVDEWLWAHGFASYHGFPITFSTTAGIMILVGLFLFIHLLRDNPASPEGIPFDEA